MSVLSASESSRVDRTSETDRRSEPRYKCPRLVRIRAVTVPESNLRLSQVQDVSANGIGLLHGSPFPLGTMLEIQLAGCMIQSRIARVVHCTRQDGGWMIGCTLNHSLSTTELERLMH
ncbi:MAG TPA: PilZ domain-containing protein [Gemmataceae bacterium]|nr:PilZ domain-containing protein [Gemmataceae bacterium]